MKSAWNGSVIPQLMKAIQVLGTHDWSRRFRGVWRLHALLQKGPLQKGSDSPRLGGKILPNPPRPATQGHPEAWPRCHLSFQISS